MRGEAGVVCGVTVGVIAQGLVARLVALACGSGVVVHAVGVICCVAFVASPSMNRPLPLASTPPARSTSRTGPTIRACSF